MGSASARVVLFGVLLIARAVIARDGLQLARAVARELADFHPARNAIPLPTNADALALRPVTIPVSGVGTIHGRYALTHNAAAILLLHGTGSNRREILDVAGRYRAPGSPQELLPRTVRRRPRGSS